MDIEPARVLGSQGQLLIPDGVLDKYVSVGFKSGGVKVTALGATGLIPISPSTALQIVPRFPLANLTHMINRCGYTPVALDATRVYQASPSAARWITDLLVDGLLTNFEAVVQSGMMRSYYRRHAASSAPHGRIDISRTQSSFAARGVDHVLAYSWFERSVDNPPNRAIKAALMRAHDHYRRMDTTMGVARRRRRVAAALLHLAQVTKDHTLQCMSDPEVRGVRPLPESRSYYRDALELATALLTDQGIDFDAYLGHAAKLGSKEPDVLRLPLNSLAISTSNLFEAFVRETLQVELASDETLEVVDGNKADGQLPLYEHLADEERRVLPAHFALPSGTEAGYTSPDILIRDSSGRHLGVVDVKYTKAAPFTARSEVEQVLLYGTRYRAPFAMTVHPRPHNHQAGLHIAGRIGDVLVAQFRLDLSAPDLDLEVQSLAEAIRGLVALGN